MALEPCLRNMDYSDGSAVSFGAAGARTYSPRCLRVRLGTAVAFTGDFAVYALEPSAAGTASNPIPRTAAGTSLRVTFPAVGFYPYYGRDFGTAAGAGMAGVVMVVP